jgi:ATP-binding cassette subfamily G (WHITE) protein 2
MSGIALKSEKPKYGSMEERGNGAVLSFHNLNYSVKVRETGYACFAKYKTKKIIKGVSGIMRPGMNAILGPSGSGKTTLLDILAGRKETGTLQGTILVDGKPLPKNFRCISGYVVQDDLVMGTLTVRENLHFSASLRLPQSTTKHERDAKIDQVLADLGLTHVSNSKIGTQFLRGISGGERRRTNIGMELVISPGILFLDEPTTGLDAYTAASVMRLLANISKRGYTMIFSIHQPRYSVYKVFDSFTLLTEGQMVYHGIRDTALTHFEQQGLVPEAHTNPADFFLDKVQTIKEEEKFDSNNRLSLAVSYEASKYAKIVKGDLDEIYEQYQASNSASESLRGDHIGYPTSSLYQMYVVAVRAMTNIIRDPTLAFMQYLNHILQAVVVGFLYHQISDNPKSAIQDRYGSAEIL